MIERTRPGWERWLAVAGFAYVVLHFVYFAAASVVDPGASVRSVQHAFTHSSSQLTLSGSIEQAVALIFLLFAISLRAHLQAGDREPKTLSSLIVPAAFAGVVLSFVGSGCTFILAHNVAKLGDANLTYGLLSMWWATFVAYDVMVGIVVLAASVSGLTSRLFPRWLGWLGIVIGLAMAGGCLAFYPSGGVVNGTADGVIYIAENLLVIWAIAGAVVVLRGRRTARAIEPTGLHAEAAAAR